MSIADDDDTNDPTIFGHSAAEGAVGVAAHFHGDLNNVESFSSRGPTQILFDTAGNAASDLRDTPLLAAPDGVTTTTDGFGTLFGTSASAPHIAAAAALILERASDLSLGFSVDDLYRLLFRTAVDMESAGQDSLSGFGRIDLQAALASVPEPTGIVMALTMSMAMILQRGRGRHVS